MPGAPDTSTRLPFTIPPPSTRSSSPIPVENRTSSVPEISFSRTGRLPAPGARILTLWLPRFSSRMVSSAMVFQLPQDGHFPYHLGES